MICMFTYHTYNLFVYLSIGSTPILHKFFTLAWHNVQRTIILQIRIFASRLEILTLNLILVILPYAVTVFLADWLVLLWTYIQIVL